MASDHRQQPLAAAQSSNHGRFNMEFVGYCVKCREKRTVKDAKVVKTAKGRPMAKGVCPKCGTTVTRFLSDKEAKK